MLLNLVIMRIRSSQNRYNINDNIWFVYLTSIIDIIYNKL